MARVAVALVLLLAVVPSAVAAPAPKSITVAFAGAAGTQGDRLNMTYVASPVCTLRSTFVQNVRNIAWKAKWSKVKLPRKGKERTVRRSVRVTGSSQSEATGSYDPGCGQPPPPPERCEDQPFVLGHTARLTLSWKGSRLAAAVALADDFGEDETARAAQGDEACAPGLRSPAYSAAVLAPARSARPVVTPVDPSANADAPDIERRPHAELQGSDGGAQYDVVSDVAWAGVVTVRYNRRR